MKITMNTKLALTAITLFAVTMGIGFLTPALAEKMSKVDVCHYHEAETLADGTVTLAFWGINKINGNAESAHVEVHTDGAGLFDFVVIDDDLDDTNDSQDCTDRNSPLV